MGRPNFRENRSYNRKIIVGRGLSYIDYKGQNNLTENNDLEVFPVEIIDLTPTSIGFNLELPKKRPKHKIQEPIIGDIMTIYLIIPKIRTIEPLIKPIKIINVKRIADTNKYSLCETLRIAIEFLDKNRINLEHYQNHEIDLEKDIVFLVKNFLKNIWYFTKFRM